MEYGAGGGEIRYGLGLQIDETSTLLQLQHHLDITVGLAYLSNVVSDWCQTTKSAVDV